MQSRKLLKESLDNVRERNLTIDPQQAQFAKVAIQQIEAFDKLCQMRNWSVEIEELLQLTTEPPELTDSEQEGYAIFVHQVMTHGECHGLVHEDPHGAYAILGGALALCRQLAIEQQRLEFLPQALDLMLLQSIAHLGSGARDLARTQLLSILDLTAIKQEGSDFLPEAIAPFMKQVLLRAAPAAFMLAELFRAEKVEKRALLSLKLAGEFFEEVLNLSEAAFPGTHSDRVMSTMALSEVYLRLGEKEEGLTTLDRAIELVERDLELMPFSGTYCYVSSVVYQRRAEILAMEEKWEGAFVHYEKGLEFARQALNLAPHNPHYLDHHGDLLNEFGIVHGVRGAYSEAQNIFLQAIEERRKLTDRCTKYYSGLAVCLHNMATLMKRSGRDQIALVYLEEALETLDKVDEDDLDDRDEVKAAILSDAQELRRELNTNAPHRSSYSRKLSYGPN